MSYIGRDLRTGAFRQLDDISSGFDGSDTPHTMQVNSTNVSVGDVNQILLSLGGVIQKPGTDFTVSGSTLTFTTAPAANTSFFAILLGSDNGGTVTPTDGSVTGDKIANDLSISTNVTITTDDNSDTLTLTSTDADANAGPNLRFYRNSSSPADDDVIGRVDFEGRNNNSEDIIYANIQGEIMQEADGSEDGQLQFGVMKAGTLRNAFTIDRVATVFNEDSQDIDFRVETDTSTHAFFVDGGNDVIGLYNTSPSFTTGTGMHLGDDIKLGFGAGGSSRPDFQLSADSSNLKLACGFGSDTADINISTSAEISTGQETSPDATANGLCLNQGAEDLNIMTFKSSDVAHGMTANFETDTFLALRKNSSTGGGITFSCLSEGSEILKFNVNQTDGTTTKSSSASGAVVVGVSQKSGNGVNAVGTDDNLMVITNYINTRFIFDAEGTFHSDVGTATYDAYEDAHLVRAMDLSTSTKGLIASKFDEFIQYKHEDLADAKIVGRDEDGTPNTMVNWTAMSQLHNGAIWQQYEKHQKLANAVYELAKAAVGEDKANEILEQNDIKLLN